MNIERIQPALNKVLHQSGASSAAIYLQSTKHGRIHFLHTQGLTGQVVNDYCKGGIYRFDPFNDTALLQDLSTRGDVTQVIDTSDTRLSVDECHKYREFLQQYNLVNVCAGMRQIGPKFCLTIGLHGDTQWRVKLNSHTRNAMDTLTDSVLAQLTCQLMSLPGAPTRLDALLGEVLGATENRLRPQDREIISMLAQGALNKQIAPALGLSETAVENRLRRLFRLYAVRNRTALLSAIEASNH